jgi:PAS domain S-box-containing protein
MGKDSAGVKLGIAFAVLISLLIGVGWLGLSRMGQIDADWNEILNQRWRKLELANQAVFYANSNYRMTSAVVLMKHNSRENMEWFPPRREENKGKVDSAIKKIDELAGSEKEKELLAKIKEARAPSNSSVSKLIELLRTPGKENEARVLMAEETTPLMNRYRDAWGAFVQYEEEAMVQAKTLNEANYAATRQYSIALVLLAIAVAIGIAILVTGMSRDLEDREQSKIATHKLNEELEKKVHERTEALVRTVETLKGEVFERRSREEDFRRLASIVECSDDAIIAASLDGVVTDWNAGAERMFGFTRNEMIGKSLALIMPAERSREPSESQAKLLRGESVVRFESVRLRKGGAPIEVAIAVSPIIDQDGRIIGGSAILRDITDRKFMEDALRRSEASSRSFVENAPFGILRTTLEGRILQANPALVKMLGYSSEQEVLSLRMGTDVYLHPEERDEATLWCRKQDAIQGIEVEWKEKSGRPFIIRCAAHVVKDSNGNVEYMEGFVEDISERRAMEQQLRQGQKMEAIGRLAGGIAHDFNNLLGVIIGYGDYVSEQIGAGSPMHHSVEQILKAADRASALTRQLLAFSRQQVLEKRVLNLNAVVADMEKMLPRLLGEDIQLETSLDPALGQVKADQGQIEQVIMNLAVNARDAMPDGGRLLIQTGNVSSEDEFVLTRAPMPPGEYVMLLVKDTGTGMDAQTQANIFEPFFTTKEPGKGTGLGLATVYGFVKQSGGYVWVDSEPGNGTTFRIYLPRVHGEVTQRLSSAAPSASHHGAETILLAEDEESLRTLTRNLLEESGYTVLEAASGMEAVELARKYPGPIHLLLTDLVMPGMSGQTVSEKLVLMRPEIRILYMSGYAGFTARGFTDLDAVIIPKPFTRDTLLQKLRETFDLEERPESI